MDRMDTYIGFDSAWTDNPKAPGACCAVTFDDRAPVRFHTPRLTSFDKALGFIQDVRTEFTLVALDQPTVVPNMTSMRPVERAAASLVSWLGGGVQPSNRGRIGMFCDNSPIWAFLSALGAVEDPEAARGAAGGLYLMEVFPAIALASFGTEFFGRLKAPRYNPGRVRTYLAADWVRVAEAAAMEAQAFGCDQLAEWCRDASRLPRPKKADQDRLDAAICVLIAIRWRRRPRQESIMLGDLKSGYMIMPASPQVREKLTAFASARSVPLDHSAGITWVGHPGPGPMPMQSNPD
jgi:predicted RNase H-like nuclease